MFVRLRHFLAGRRNWVLTFVVMIVGLIIGGICARVIFQRGDLAYRFVPGERLHYQLRFAGSGAMDLNAITRGPKTAYAADQAQSLQMVVEGELVVDVLEKQDDLVLLAYSLPKAEMVLSLGGFPLVDAASGIAAQLSQPVFAEVDFQGRIRSLRFPPASSELSRNCMRSLLAAVQVILPKEDEEQHEWETWEHGSQGFARSVYQSGADSPWGMIGLVKARQEYDRPSAKNRLSDATISTTLHPEGSLRIVFDPGLGQVRAIAGTEIVTMKAGDKILSANESRISMEFQSKEILGGKVLERLTDMGKERVRTVAGETLAMPPAQRDEMLTYKLELGDATLESLQTDLARAEREAAPDKDRTPLYLKFKALIAVHPETSARLGEISAGADPQSLTMKLLPAALGAVGHEPGQLALLALLKARANDEAALRRLLVILSQLKKPTELAEQALRDLAMPSPGSLHDGGAVANLAQLCLGTMGKNLAETAPERTTKIVAWAVQQLQSAKSDDATCQFLMMLGNVGTAETLPAIRPYLSDKAVAVRVVAVGSLRFIDLDEAEDLLIKALAADPDADVRNAAISAFRQRFMTAHAFEAQQQAMRGDASSAVRLAAMNLLWQMRETNPEVIALVTAAAANDLSLENRETARKMLAGIP